MRLLSPPIQPALFAALSLPLLAAAQDIHPPNLSLDGSALGGYWNYTSVCDRLQGMAQRSPQLVEYGSLGTSLEGRSIPYLTFSNKANNAIPPDSRPSLLMTSLSGGDEPSSLAASLGIAQYLTEEHAETSALLAAIKIVVVPIVNPDAWSAATSTAFTKKNRRKGCDDASLAGVDLSKNWDFHFDTYLPSSDVDANIKKYEDPCSPSYHGDAPFSEPETAALKTLIDTTVKPKAVLFFRQTTNAQPALVIPYAYHPSNAAVQSTRQLFRPEDAKEFEAITAAMNTDGKTYAVSTMWDVAGETVSGSEMDWTFDQAGIFAVSVMVAPNTDSAIEYSGSKHLPSTLALANMISTLPAKAAKPNKKGVFKHIKKAVLNVPLVLGALAALFLAVGYGVARYLGYDKIWDRFTLGVNRIKRWRMTRNYRQLGAQPVDDGDDEDFGWAMDDGLAEEGSGGFAR
ncbi:hypothetical protein HDU87_006604 [Geranomyces variabilis]|uniref:Carboxypeptidase M14B n=1 Tax=Geranomyces variabilis TaxID=109894 RepID=A0AAD5TF25_9FUNG|nr:hypothetical protein HDU87_006604 [Geranomyces variabilis]